jgi:diguanylate cyclase (GGDEF)-like protein
VAQENHSFRRLELVTTPLINKDGEFSGVIEISRDITEHLELLQELQTHKENLDHLTLHDPLTNLPNRTLLLNKLEQLIIKTQGTHKSIAVLFIDLDHFKQINDSLGHAFGDQILEMASERFYQCVDINDTVARLGGDEFAIILESLSQGQNSALMAQNIIKAMEKPFEIELHQLYLTASIGISLYPQDGIDAQTLLRNADAAMYKAKDEGRNTFQFYTESMTEQAFERILMDVSLRKALSKDELLVYYQPQFDLKTRKIVGVEALVRWNHPDLGLVLPDRFISVAEETGLIIPLGNIVMEKAFHQISQWNHQFDTNLKVAVNISVRQIFDARFIANLKQLLSKTQCNPKWLELEVTEGLIMDKPEVSIKIMEQIRAIGIDLAIDDFGTGYSSLSYLKRFPITRLKIDSSFIRDIPDDVDDIAITNAIIALGKSLNISIIAEGIETDAQNNYLINEGCQFGQGFIYSRPLAASEMSLLLQKQSQKQLSS